MRSIIRVLVALSDPEDRRLAEKALSDAGFKCSTAADLATIENMIGDTDVVITDTSFSSGSFADWLSLWPVPAVLAVMAEADISRLAEQTADEASSFILMDAARDWIRFIPIMARKSAAIRESINRQNTNVIRAESSYMNLLRVVPDIVYVLDGDGCFVYLNDAVSQLGWKPSELLGKHFAEIVHPDDLPEVGRSIVLRRFEGVTTGPESAPKLFDERRAGDRMTRGLEVRLRHRDGDEWTKANVDAWGEVSSLGVNLPEFQGQGTGTIGLIHDVSERREAERKMSRELDARDILLKEIHHRVKNNLQVVSSLLSLESDCVEDEKAKAVFVDCQTQVQSMALVHEQIYRGSAFEGVEAAGYFARLAEYLGGIHDADARGISIHVKTGDIVLPLDTAMPLSIITTELVSNSFKHAYPDGRRGVVTISLTDNDGAYEFSVSDDGIGFEASKTLNIDRGKIRGLGMDLIEALAGQIGGSIERIDSEGAASRIRFSAKAKG